MKSATYRFLLDMQSVQSQISIPVLRGDTNRTFRISLSDGGNPYIIEDGCLAVLTIKRPSGTRIEEFCSVEDNTTIVYPFEQNTAIEEGVHNCDVTLYDTEGETIATPRFTMVVSERVLNPVDIVVDDEDFTIINAIVAKEAARQNAEKDRVASEESRTKAEAERVEAEAKRVEAEAERINAGMVATASAERAEQAAKMAEEASAFATAEADRAGEVARTAAEDAVRELSSSAADVATKAAEDKVERLVGELGVVQTTGDSITSVMSQKAVTDELTGIKDSLGSAVKYSANNEANGVYVIAYHFIPKHTYLLTNTSASAGLSAASRIEKSGADTEVITSWIGSGTDISFTPTTEAFYLRVYFTAANGSIEIIDTDGLANRFSEFEMDYGVPFLAQTVAQTNQYYKFPIIAGHTYLFRNTSPSGCTMNAWTQNVAKGTDIDVVATNLGMNYESSFTATSDAGALRVYATTDGTFEIRDLDGLKNKVANTDKAVGQVKPIVEEELKEVSSNYTWELGTLSNGQDLGAGHRCRTEHIPCKKGDIVFGDVFEFTVSEYDSSMNFISVSNYVNRYEVLNEGYIRILSRKADDSSVTSADIEEISGTIFIARIDGVYGRLSVLEKAMDNKGYYHQVDQKVEELFDKVKADTDSNTLVIGVTTDNHYSPITNRGRNQLIYASVYKQVCEELGVDLHLNLGDIIDESEVEGEEMTVNRERIADMARAVANTYIPFAYAIAHHEGKPHIGINSQGESEYTFPTEKTFGLLGRYCRHLTDVHMSDNKNSTSYYIDFDMQKIRLVVLDSVSNSQTGYSAKVVNFLSNEALKNVPSGYKVLVASHVPTRASANWDGYSVTNGPQIESALKTYAVNGGTVLAHIHGHTHWDNIVKEGDMPYPLISLCCAGVDKMDVVTYGTAKGVVGNPTSYDRNNDDYSAYCMDIFCVHCDTGEINMYRFGVGNDRTYAPN